MNEQEYTWKDYIYTVDSDDSATLVCYIGDDEEVVVPAAIEGHTLLHIGANAFEECVNLVNVVLPEGVLSIGEESFCDCDSLTHIHIPESVAMIAESAFDGCESLNLEKPNLKLL